MNSSSRRHPYRKPPKRQFNPYATQPVALFAVVALYSLLVTALVLWTYGLWPLF